MFHRSAGANIECNGDTHPTWCHRPIEHPNGSVDNSCISRTQQCCPSNRYLRYISGGETATWHHRYTQYLLLCRTKHNLLTLNNQFQTTNSSSARRFAIFCPHITPPTQCVISFGKTLSICDRRLIE